MAGQTVIDQFIVKLGLDPRDFDKGTKQAAASVVNAENNVRKSTDGMGRSITSLAGKWLTATAIIAGIRKGITVIDDVAERTRRLGIDSKNMGQESAAAMRNWENAVEDAGGSAEEARKTIGGLNKALFDLAYNGQVSDSLVMLGRLGVQFQDASGQARDFKSVVLDTADAIGKAQAQGMSRQDAFQYLQQSGFDAGTAQLILEGRGAIESGLATQGSRRQVSGEDVQKATDIRRASIGKDQALEGAKIAGMETFGGVQEEINKFIEKLASPGGVNKALDDLGDKATKLGTAFDDWTIRAGGTTRGLRNNNPLNIRAVGDQNADRKGFRVFRTMEDGIKAADAQLDRYAKRGINTIEKIVSTWAPPSENDTKAYIDDVVNQTGIPAGQVLEDSDRAMLIAAMARHESGKGAPDSGAVADTLQFNPDAEAMPTPNAQGGSTYNKTDVQIDNITVQTQAKDATAMADDMDGAVRRKLLASHAEQGMQ